MRKNCVSVFALVLLVVVPMIATAEDWPQWRGKNRDGISVETGLLKEWPDDGPELAWKAEGLGGGYSSIAIFDGFIYTLGDIDDSCCAIGMYEANGDIAWKTEIGQAGGHNGYPGPRSTPTVDGDDVFVLNQHGTIFCLDRTSGEKRWSSDLVSEFGGKMMSGWKYSESPLVDGDQVICTPGGKQGTLLALNRKTGEPIWQTGDWTDRAAYSSVIIAEIYGKRQYVQLTGKSVAGIDPETGNPIWIAERPGKTAVVATPVVKDNVVFVTSGYGVGCNGFRINQDWSTEEIYANTNMSNHHGGVVLLDGHVFGATSSTFRCLDVETGELDFNARSAGKGATVYADGRFYLRTESGPVALIEATTEELRELGRFDQPFRSKRKAWAHPVVANGMLYLRDQDILLCYDVREQ